MASRPDLSFSQIRGTAKNHVGRTVRKERDDLTRVRAARHRHPVDHRNVVVGVALGDVRGRQPGDHACAGVGEVDQLLDGLHRAEEVAMRELDALGRPGGARGVDEGQDVVGLDRGDRGLDVEVRVRALEVGERHGALRRLPVEHDHVLERGGLLARREDLGQVGLLDNGDLGGRVVEQVLDLLGRVGLVDRVGRGAEARDREIHDVELRAVGEHDRHGVAARDAELGEPARKGVDAIAQLRPGQRDLVLLGSHGDAIGDALGGAPEGLREVRCVNGAPPGGLVPTVLLSMGSPSIRTTLVTNATERAGPAGAIRRPAGRRRRPTTATSRRRAG